MSKTLQRWGSQGFPIDAKPYRLRSSKRVVMVSNTVPGLMPGLVGPCGLAYHTIDFYIDWKGGPEPLGWGAPRAQSGPLFADGGSRPQPLQPWASVEQCARAGALSFCRGFVPFGTILSHELSPLGAGSHGRAPSRHRLVRQALGASRWGFPGAWVCLSGFDKHCPASRALSVALVFLDQGIRGRFALGSPRVERRRKSASPPSLILFQSLLVRPAPV